MGGRIRRAFAVSTAAFLLVAAAQAEAGPTIGETEDQGSGGVYCVYGGTHIQTSSNGGRYAAPFDGVITSWQNGGRWQPAVTFKVVRLGPGSSYSVIGSDGPRDYTVAPYTIQSYPVRIQVRQGDVIGAHIPTANRVCFWDDGEGETYGLDDANLPAGGSGTFDSTGVRSVPVQATIERDRDNDGYGDETQDLCPTDRTLHSVCDTFPPETSITAGPKKKTTSKKARFVFSSSEPGSTFECSLDGARFRPCASPMKVTVKELGRHNFLVRARDTHANLDTTEAGRSWKVVKKRKKHKR